jgi:putative phosphoribosyl transferase
MATEHAAQRTVRVRPNDDGVVIVGDLTIPEQPTGLVVFAHGSGSSRHSPRNRAVAGGLRQARLATLLLDLLTADEELVDARTAGLRFDIDLLAQRLVATLDWVREERELAALPVGLFGASTGAAAALVAAARRPAAVRAVVSRGGRPDLAGDALREVHAPTLLIVGGLDRVVLDLNRAAAAQLAAPATIRVVPGASHLFSEPGALEQVTQLAGSWFAEHLP